VRSRLFGPLLLDAVGCESAPVYGCRTQPGACLALANDCRESDAGTWRRNSTDALTAPLPSSGGHVKEQWCGHQRGQPDSRARGWAGLSLHDKPRSVLHEEPRPLPVSYGRCAKSWRGPSQADRCLGQSNAEKRLFVRPGLSTFWRNDNIVGARGVEMTTGALTMPLPWVDPCCWTVVQKMNVHRTAVVMCS